MSQPLVIRPSYRRDPLATAELPGGGPSDKGLSLSDDIPGTQTFTKPLDDHGTNEEAQSGSIYRVDGPRDIGKRQEGDDSIDHSQATPGYMGLGERDPGDYGKTKYPYRDNKPNTHNASEEAHFVAQLYILRRKADLLLPYRQQTSVRVAATAEQILSNLNPKFVARSLRVAVTLKRADPSKLRWIFSVKGNGTYAVKVKAFRPKKNWTKFSKMDLELTCSCPAWRWQGPEYHGTQEDFQLGRPVGTASTPDIRDPKRINRVCKHVAAVLETTRNWDIPVRRLKTKSKSKSK